jgi:hypothetical protein
LIWSLFIWSLLAGLRCVESVTLES